MEVVILAGGAGRRFGEVKQLVPVAPDGATLLEVTLRDAVGAGCDRAAIVTAPGLEDEVRDLFAGRPQPGCRITVVTQDPQDLPVKLAVDRDRPWGTAHALWAARKVVGGPFLLFNADDHYGANAPAALAASLNEDRQVPRFAMLGYPLGDTLSGAGTVSRAVCETDAGGLLKAMREYPAIDGEGRITGGEAEGRALPLDAPVSMNAWGLTPAIFPLLEKYLRDFLTRADLTKDECYLPAAIDAGVQSGAIEVQVIPTSDRWCGMTYPEDRVRVSQRLTELSTLEEAAREFGVDDGPAAPVPFGSGLVHTTWRLESPRGSRLLQRLNAGVFPDPVAMAENAAAVALRIDDALAQRGDKDDRHRLVYESSQMGRPWWRDGAGRTWRCLVLIPGARPSDPSHPGEIRAAARALGRFPGLVAQGRGPELKTILPGFHDTPSRLNAFRQAAEENPRGRFTSCQEEYERLMALSGLSARLTESDLPLRPVHNDAKLDNVLVDAGTGEALCVIDLDTAMPGLTPHDFGDLVRSAVTGRPEDEPDLDTISVRKVTFTKLAAGYLEGARDWLTGTERERLVDGALVITYEQSLRFLTDYLVGDVYYRTRRAGHNLERARAQLALLEKLLAVEDDLRQVIAGS